MNSWNKWTQRERVLFTLCGFAFYVLLLVLMVVL